ncbi:MAG TPA: di-heme oxidoredictase family protein [Longimicrobiales bacterium]
MLLALFVSACGSGTPPVAGVAGAPLPDLAEAEAARFLAGKALFNRVFTPEDGLGPAFNENQCSACHTVPAEGGTTGFERVVKATRTDEAGRCDLLIAEGGENVRTQATPLLRAAGIERESDPPGAAHRGRFLPTFLFGLGLVEAIPDEVIAARADPHDRNGDGISGRAARGADGRLTRFGRKSDIGTLEDFTRSALRLEMGLTTRADERDLVNGAPPPDGADPAPEPEVDPETVALLTDFVRYLAPPAPAPPRSPAHADSIARGRRLFESIGCIQCHTPALRTGPHTSTALRYRTIQLYSDLLLHDLGPGLANVCAFDAGPRELRTAMLMGLQHRSFYLHDGRAIDLRDAILAHGGEAQAIRDRFAGLPWLEQEKLILFLRSL